MRLSPPTTRTFTTAVSALLLGIVFYTDWLGLDIATDVSFWLVAGGGVLLAIGAVFNRI